MLEAPPPEGPLRPLQSHAVALLAAILFAVTYGFNFGVGNQTLYFLPSLKLLDAELYARDWTFTHATHYHQAYAYVGALLLSLDPRGWGVALGHTAVVAAGTFSLYPLLRALTRRLALPGFLLLVLVLLATRTRGPAMTYAFDAALQPSTLSSALLFGTAAAFVAGRYRLSGVLLGLSGLFHLNLLVLAAGAFGLAQLALGRSGLLRRLLEQLGPVCLVLLLFAPTLLGAAGGGGDVKLGRAIFLYVRTPHHYLLSNRVPEFGPLLGWLLVAHGVMRPLLAEKEGAPFLRLGAAALGMASVVGLGIAAAQVSDGARLLFSWRLASHAEVLLQAGVVAAVARLAVEPGLLRRYGRRELLAIGGGFALSFASFATLGRFRTVEVTLALVLILALALRAEHAGAARRPTFDAWRERFGPRALTALAVLLVVGLGANAVVGVARRSTLLSGLPRTEATLYSWMRKATDKSAVFLLPPELEEARFHSRRAVVVDWKGAPAVPSETLAWYRRIEDVTGRPGLRSVKELAGYDELDPARLERLRARYELDYVVVRRGREKAFDGYAMAYRNKGFVVLRPPARRLITAAL